MTQKLNWLYREKDVLLTSAKIGMDHLESEFGNCGIRINKSGLFTVNYSRSKLV